MSVDKGNSDGGVKPQGVHFVPGLLAVVGADDQIEAIAEEVGGTPVGPDELDRLMGTGPTDEGQGQGGGMSGNLFRLARFISVPDPVSAATELADRDEAVRASPIHALGYLWHTVFSELDTEGKVESHDFGVDAATEIVGSIAMVDSGVVLDGTPPWFSDHVEPVGNADIEVGFGEASHGTFVASMLRQTAQDHRVVVARAGRHEGSRKMRIEGDKSHDEEPSPSTEAHVADAILRLIDHLEDAAVSALNLSIGGPAVDIPGRAMVLLSAAIDSWREAHPRAPIFAAVGNSTDPRKVYPAAFREVRGVAACNAGGDPIAWLNQAGGLLQPSPQAVARTKWTDDLASGAGLVGLSGHGDEAIRWSGSSFATPIASGTYSTGASPTSVVDGITHWTR